VSKDFLFLEVVRRFLADCEYGKPDAGLACSRKKLDRTVGGTGSEIENDTEFGCLFVCGGTKTPMIILRLLSTISGPILYTADGDASEMPIPIPLVFTMCNHYNSLGMNPTGVFSSTLVSGGSKYR
jgi:hypothetical protein